MTRRRLKSALRLILSLPLLAVAADRSARAADINLLSAAALRSSMNEIIPAFEKSSAHKVKAAFGTSGALVLRIQRDEPADLGIVTGGQVDDLQKQGKILAGSKANIARVGIGIYTRKGAAKLDIGSIEAFKRTLLAAKSIGHLDFESGAPSGAFAARLLSSLDIATEIKPKIRAIGAGTALFRAVAEGDVEIAFGQITEILEVPSVELIGPLPAQIQNYTSFAAGVLTLSERRDTAKSLIAFLTSPAAVAVMKAKGLEPLQN